MDQARKSVTVGEVLAFIRAQFDEGDEAADRLQGRRFGWEVDTQSREYIDSQHFSRMLIGNGPILIDRRTGNYWFTSSNPDDVFGDSYGSLGYTQLTTRARLESWREENDSPDGNIREGSSGDAT